MIHYQLRCRNNHDFDGWFANSSAFEEQNQTGLISCPHCADINIERALMAPAIGRRSNRIQNSDSTDLDQQIPPSGTLQRPANSPISTALPSVPFSEPMLNLINEMRAEIEKNCDYVGSDFAEEARKIHYGETDPRGIYGETTLDEAKELVDEGIEIAALPWSPRTHS
jgi:hypothetical protein